MKQEIGLKGKTQFGLIRKEEKGKGEKEAKKQERKNNTHSFSAFILLLF